MDKQIKSLYFYEGPILRFGKPVSSRWKAQTMAVSPAKAKSNFAWQARQVLGLTNNVPITLPGKIKLAS